MPNDTPWQTRLHSPQAAKTGIVLADLHIGQAGSTAFRVMHNLEQRLSEWRPDLIVLNGDIIEGTKPRGNTLEEMRETISQSADRLEHFINTAIRANPQAQIIYIYGNHDSVDEVAAHLERIQARYPDNVMVDGSGLRIMNTLFMHGDVPLEHSGLGLGCVQRWVSGDAVLKPTHRYERTYDGTHPDHSAWKKLEEIWKYKTNDRITTAVNFLDTAVSHIAFPPKEVIAHIHAALEKQPDKPLEGLERVCIGHIHPQPGNTKYHHEGIDFLVTCPATIGNDAMLYRFDIADEGLHNFTPVMERSLNRHPFKTY